MSTVGIRALDFAAHAAVYWWLVIGSLLLFTVVWAAPFLSRRKPWMPALRSDRTFVATAALVLLATRWPTLFGRDPYIDEAQMIAQAITAAHHPIPWRSFDGTTSGPLNTYALLLSQLVGLGVSVVGARVVALVFAFVTIAALFLAVRAVFGSWIARIAIVAPLLVFGLASIADLVCYGSETLPVMLLTIPLAIAARIATSSIAPRGWTIGAGLCCGAVPFAKLQGTPLACAVAATCLLALLGGPRDLKRAVRDAAWFAGGIVAIPGIILTLVLVSGAFADFAISYIGQALASMAGDSVTLQTAMGFPEYRSYFPAAAAALILSFTAWLLLKPPADLDDVERDRLRVGSTLVALGLVLVSWYTIEAPHRPYAHYFAFAIVPLTLLVVTFAGTVRARLAQRHRVAIDAALGAFILLTGIPLLAFAAHDRDRYLADVPNGIGNAPDAVAREIARVDTGGGRVAIWGYAPYLYVKSHTMMGTRDSVSQFQILPGPYQGYYRRRFLSDMENIRPALFVDACAPGQFNFTSRSLGFESFPALAAYVNEHYTPVVEVNGVRIYRRHDVRS